VQAFQNPFSLAQIESGKFQLEAVDFDLAHEIQSVVDMFGIQCAGKGIIIGLEVAG
jgi:signal transduction histidine kinase